MSRPSPSIDPSRLVGITQVFVKAARFPYRATPDGDRPRVRPVSTVRTDGYVG